MDEARSSGGCSAEQAEVLLNFLEVAIHTILYARAVYPQELFELRKQYNVPVRMARHPVLRDYISSLLTEDHLGHWLQRGLVDQLVLAILAPDGQPLERFVFELASLRPAAPHHSNGAQAMRNPTVGDQAGSAVQDMDSENLATIAESALRACLIRLSGCTRSLMPNQPAEQHSEPGASDLTFSVVIYMRGEGAALGPPSPAHPNATDAWVEAVGSERCEVRQILLCLISRSCIQMRFDTLCFLGMLDCSTEDLRRHKVMLHHQN